MWLLLHFTAFSVRVGALQAFSGAVIRVIALPKYWKLPKYPKLLWWALAVSEQRRGWGEIQKFPLSLNRSTRKLVIKISQKDGEFHSSRIHPSAVFFRCRRWWCWYFGLTEHNKEGDGRGYLNLSWVMFSVCELRLRNFEGKYWGHYIRFNVNYFHLMRSQYTLTRECEMTRQMRRKILFQQWELPRQWIKNQLMNRVKEPEGRPGKI